MLERRRLTPTEDLQAPDPTPGLILLAIVVFIIRLVQDRRVDANMKTISRVGIVLMVLGALVFVYQGIDYTRQKDVLDVGSVHVTKETHIS